ncbi:MAG: hypothetical protein ABIJ14_02660 [Nanoarchaeota archaeon]
MDIERFKEGKLGELFNSWGESRFKIVDIGLGSVHSKRKSYPPSEGKYSIPLNEEAKIYTDIFVAPKESLYEAKELNYFLDSLKTNEIKKEPDERGYFCYDKPDKEYFLRMGFKILMYVIGQFHKREEINIGIDEEIFYNSELVELPENTTKYKEQDALLNRKQISYSKGGPLLDYKHHLTIIPLPDEHILESFPYLKDGLVIDGQNYSSRLPSFSGSNCKCAGHISVKELEKHREKFAKKEK